MGKAPSFQFNARDWLSDSQLQMASFSTKGMWINFLCFMWEAPEKGKLVGTREQLSHLIRAAKDEFDNFVEEAKNLEFCVYAECNGIVTLINRRMYNEWKTRESTRLRVEKHRSVGLCNASGNGSGNAIVQGSGDLPGIKSVLLDYNVKSIYLECIYLTTGEFQKLQKRFGKVLVDKAIEILNNYIMGNRGGKDPYKSHYHALLGWPIERATEKAGGDNGRGRTRNSGGGSGVQTTPPEWTGTLPAISEEQRQANLAKLKALGCGVDED